MQTIAQAFSDAALFFNQLYWGAKDWPWPWSLTYSWWDNLRRLFYVISTNIWDFGNWVSSAETNLAKILSISQIQSYFQTWINYATTAWGWVNQWTTNVTWAIDRWWVNTTTIVQAWINNAMQWAQAQINTLALSIADILEWWNSVVDDFPSFTEILQWFTNWWANILTNINLWWIDRLVEVKAYVFNWVWSLKGFWDGWSEIRDKVYAFINDPLEWLWNKFTDWFLGVE